MRSCGADHTVRSRLPLRACRSNRTSRASGSHFARTAARNRNLLCHNRRRIPIQHDGRIETLNIVAIFPIRAIHNNIDMRIIWDFYVFNRNCVTILLSRKNNAEFLNECFLCHKRFEFYDIFHLKEPKNFSFCISIANTKHRKLNNNHILSNISRNSRTPVKNNFSVVCIQSKRSSHFIRSFGNTNMLFAIHNLSNACFYCSNFFLYIRNLVFCKRMNSANIRVDLFQIFCVQNPNPRGCLCIIRRIRQSINTIVFRCIIYNRNKQSSIKINPAV